MKKKKSQNTPENFDPELLRQYMMGATNPGFSNKISYQRDTVDLHLEEIHSGKAKIPPQDALFHQLEKFELELSNAIAAGKFELRVIHGLGKGKLKSEIYRILDKHPNVRGYKNDYHSKYGYGSTIIQFT
jgi:DNA-nicking Smr family endonuclease